MSLSLLHQCKTTFFNISQGRSKKLKIDIHRRTNWRIAMSTNCAWSSWYCFLFKFIKVIAPCAVNSRAIRTKLPFPIAAIRTRIESPWCNYSWIDNDSNSTASFSRILNFPKPIRTLIWPALVQLLANWQVILVSGRHFRANIISNFTKSIRDRIVPSSYAMSL